MLRYQSRQNIEKQIERRQISLKRSSNTVLKTRNQTILKENKTNTNLITKTKLIQKQKLIVYKKNDKFYIDNSAAYALKITNVRAIMTENQHFIEISLNQLSEIQHDDTIDIEYREMDRIVDDLGKNRNEADLEMSLNELEKGEYGIGIHGIDKGNREEKQGIADNISSEGLDINNKSKTILSTSISLGTNENMRTYSRN